MDNKLKNLLTWEAFCARSARKNRSIAFFRTCIAGLAKKFLKGFPGRVLYAVKANSDPTVLKLLIKAGIRHFDCASLPEIELVDAIDPDAKKYFMVPVRIRGAARTAQEKHGVRHFMVDHLSALPRLLEEIDPSRSVIFARMAVHHESAMEDLSARFGAPPEEMPSCCKQSVTAVPSRRWRLTWVPW